ncbi:hypothetical protein ABZ832_24610 [Streptantibioticus parmotrematis]|uniref:hypothetical protein n=1 Tax=Streptantibioticus parmotrematis TaxID=2873249 RepID=UPI0033F73934
MENTTTSRTAAAPGPASGKNSSDETAGEPARAGTGPTRSEHGEPPNGRVLDLVALVVLIALAAFVSAVAGPTMFTAVTSVGVGLFATWRSTRSRPSNR